MLTIINLPKFKPCTWFSQCTVYNVHDQVSLSKRHLEHERVYRESVSKQSNSTQYVPLNDMKMNLKDRHI